MLRRLSNKLLALNRLGNKFHSASLLRLIWITRYMCRAQEGIATFTRHLFLLEIFVDITFSQLGGKKEQHSVCISIRLFALEK